MERKTALVAGGSGLIGDELLQILLESPEYEQVIAIVRKALPIKHKKLKEIIVDFDRLQDFSDEFMADDVFCCLGTTIKKAKTKKEMFKVDVEYPIAVAELAKEQGAKGFYIVSAIGADKDSSVFYLKMKGQLETHIQKISYEQVGIFRPSLLLGEREEFRLGEKMGGMIATLFSPLMTGSLKKYRAIKGETVAKAMYMLAQKDKKGIHIISSEEIETMVHPVATITEKDKESEVEV
ncbi:MAG: oxidoreductase [Bacillus sp. (in: firmicutes)]